MYIDFEDYFPINMNCRHNVHNFNARFHSDIACTLYVTMANVFH